MTRQVIQIDEDKCNGCGLCVTGCHEGALQLIDGKARLVGDLLCDGLGACIGECPQGAIEFVEREAEAYDERAVLERIAGSGIKTVAAHLRHLRDHGLKQYVHEAFDLLAAQGWDIAALKSEIHGDSGVSKGGCGSGGCPGSQVRDFSLKTDAGFAPARENESASAGSRSIAVPARSQLHQWPVQLKLVPPTAPFLQNCELLLTADCVPFAYPDFHEKFLKGRVLLIGCPKLDDAQAYVDKLVNVFTLNSIRSVTVVRMEVPCCSGLTAIVRQALAESGQIVPFAEAVVGVEGNLHPAR